MIPASGETAKVIQKPLKKLYYSISQASKMLGMTPEELKKWENDYPEIKPTRNRAGNRYYTQKDIYLLLFIKERLLDFREDAQKTREAIRFYRGELMEKERLQLKQTLSEIHLEVQEILALLETDPGR